MSTITLEAEVKIALQAFVRAIMDKRKAWRADDRAVLNAMVWDAIGAEAKGQSEDAWNKMLANKIYEEPPKETPIDKLVGVTPHFEVHGKVTEIIKRFNAGELAKILKSSKYKVPEPDTKQFVEKAKIGTKGNLYLSIVGKG